jgi:4-diphosphocytidyl-2-C-methyl-D-erythritol kinase
MPFRELARAKVNLTLAVRGRRADGYHDIVSLVAFAAVADRVTLHPGPDCRVTVTGPFAAAIEGANLLDRTLDLLREAKPELRLGTIELEKALPVAAGLGGGSADAAALLRAVRRANPDPAPAINWHGLAARLGADVPVCLAGVPAVIHGIGDRIEPLAGSPPLPPLSCVLVNPRAPLPTARVFAAFAANAPSPAPHRPRREGIDMKPAYVLDREALLVQMRACGNDLEPAAISLLPAIAEVKAALTAEAGCRLAAMTGSGPTCFGIFTDQEAATRAARAIAHTHPGWWTAATGLF